jgi:hypothetical protein
VIALLVLLAAAPPTTLAIISLEDVSVSAADAIVYELQLALERRIGVDVSVDRAAVGCSDPAACLVGVHRRTGAARAVLVALTGGIQRIKVDLTVVDTRIRGVVSGVVWPESEDLRSAVRGLADQLELGEERAVVSAPVVAEADRPFLRWSSGLAMGGAALVIASVAVAAGAPNYLPNSPGYALLSDAEHQAALDRVRTPRVVALGIGAAALATIAAACIARTLE